MKVYRALSRLFPDSYRAKLLAVVLGCIALPMLSLVVWLLWNHHLGPERLLVAALVGLAIALAGMLVAKTLIHHLLAPLRHAADALDAYYLDQRLPTLPDTGDDEVSRLMRGINRCLRSTDAGLQELERHALEDALTDALNRRGCEQALARSVGEVVQRDESFVLFVVDLDNLKPINDEYGHAAGDRALISLVDSARACCLGPRDWIGRWGGDEFLLGVHDTITSAQARVRAWLDVLARPSDDSRPVFVSAGCAEYRPGHDAVRLYRDADGAMYQAKFAGGGRLVCRCDDAHAAPSASLPR